MQSERFSLIPQRLIIMPALIAANLLVFAAFGLSGGGWMDADGLRLVDWGSNYGPRTTQGEPWRLLSAAFLHGGLVHLAVNMITLLDLGRQCERFYGSGRFLLLYLLSALTGSAASILWNPGVNSVGASGAIMGVLGAMLTFMLTPRNGVPIEFLKAHLTGIGIFLVYSFAVGMTDARIDHAAHAGGLVGGALCGLFLQPGRRGFALPAAGTVVLLAAVAAVVASAPEAIHDRVKAQQAERQFAADVRWFGAQEPEMLRQAQRVLKNAADPGMKPHLQTLRSQWNEVHARFSSYTLDEKSGNHYIHGLLLQYSDLQRRAYGVLADGPTGPGPHYREFEGLMKQSRKTAEAIRSAPKQGMKK